MIPALQLHLDCADYSLPSPALGCSYLISCSSPAQCEIVCCLCHSFQALIHVSRGFSGYLILPVFDHRFLPSPSAVQKSPDLTLLKPACLCLWITGLPLPENLQCFTLDCLPLLYLVGGNILCPLFVAGTPKTSCVHFPFLLGWISVP
ncbi:hypothetical protein CHARACLAT_010210 [Characodon lateralis]|uniref:Uncharacterized protein n=1 Tax=Characodon lateralis TaxID=208331 RepID=A0ABU7EJL8_9TELE|nr:hypothetical protein [Characodon lateralis]